jgi:hypothetical protein
MHPPVRVVQPHTVLDLQQGFDKSPLMRTPQIAGQVEATHRQAPFMQMRVLVEVLAQANEDPHPPQLFGSACSLTHKPLQRAKPLLHANVHALPAQTACAFATLVEHLVPHAPQLFGSLVVLTQVLVPAQSVGVLLPHMPTHADAEHTAVPELQACPHDPQLPGSLVVSTQAPLHEV